MPKRQTDRIYTRIRGGETRHYIDLRNLGGGREALVAKGETLATTDRNVADVLAGERVKELEEEKRGKAILGRDQIGLEVFALHHLRQKEKDGEGVPAWLYQVHVHLLEAVAFFGATTDLAILSPKDMDRYVAHLRRKDNGRGGALSDTSVRKYLNSLSNLYARAVSEEYVDKNPVANMYSKPTETDTEAAYLEPEEAALLLESARTYRAPVEDGGFAHMYPLLATFILTGGRKSEVLGLEVDDVSLRLGKVYFHPNEWRRLKTRGSKRTVPLWPQLQEILHAYMLERERTGGLGSLLFPSGRGSEEKMIRDVRKALAHIASRAGFPEEHVRLHMLRHTYTAARIQTLDRGQPVALYTVARELGHRSPNMIEDRYGHLHDRTELGGKEVVEFRVEEHQEKLTERLNMLDAVS